MERHNAREAQIRAERNFIRPIPFTGKFRAVRGKAAVKAAKRARQRARRNQSSAAS